jgi:uncharacterized LabA/DUF88 family protein
MIFIDGSNVHWALKTYQREMRSNFKIDYEKLQSVLTRNRDLVRTIYYGSLPQAEIQPGQTRFMEYLRTTGIQIVTRSLKKREDADSGEMRLVEKGVDVALAIDLLALAWEGAYDVAIVFSGDADFVGAIEHVMKKGKNVEVLAFRNSCSHELRDTALRTTYFEDIGGLVKRD